MRPTRTLAVLAATAASVILVAAAAAWACVPSGTPGTIEATPPRAKPGQQVRLTGTAGGKTPVAVYLVSAGSALLAEIPVTRDEHSEGYQFAAMVTLPASAPTGYTALVASQENVKWQVPFTLLAEGEEVATDVSAQSGPAVSESSGAGTLVFGGVVVLIAVIGFGALLRRRGSARTGTKSEPPVPVG